MGLVYIGTAQAKPWVAVSRGLTTADSTLYTNSTLALDVETGRIVWYRHHVPGESLDMDEGFEQVLATSTACPPSSPSANMACSGSSTGGMGPSWV